jgi:hypothetical protein
MPLILLGWFFPTISSASSVCQFLSSLQPSARMLLIVLWVTTRPLLPSRVPSPKLLPRSIQMETNNALSLSICYLFLFVFIINFFTQKSPSQCLMILSMQFARETSKPAVRNIVSARNEVSPFTQPYSLREKRANLIS